MGFRKAEVVGDDKPSNITRGNFKKQIPGLFRSAAVLIILVIVVIGALVSSCFEYVRPYEYGIKQVNVGINRGLSEKVYGPGLVFVKPFGMERIHRVPKDLQLLELVSSKDGQPGRGHHYADAAEIQTSDGFYVIVDVSILFRIVDPLTVIKTLGPGRGYLYEGILPKAEPILKESLGDLKAEEFYNSPLRVEKAKNAREFLKAELETKGMTVDHLLVRYFKYSDEFQKNIEERKLQDQLVFKNQAEQKAAIAEAQLKRVTEEGEANVKVVLEEGQAYKVRRDAEKDLYIRRKNAEADLLIQLAEAKRTELENDAMRVVGADKFVALEMAEVLKGIDTIMVPCAGERGMNPLDLDQITDLFGAADTNTSRWEVQQ